jgi:hypothetical protein
MKSLAGRFVALVVAGVMALATPLEAFAGSPPLPEGEPPAENEGEETPEAESAEPPEDDKEARVAEARRHYREGQALFDEEQYAAAAEAFERSYAAIPAPNTLYNIAVSHELAEQPIPAILAYERFLGTGDIPQEERAEVDRTITRLRAMVGELELPVGVEVAEVRVNGETIERFPHLVMPGPVRVEVVGTKEGQRLERTYDMRPGDRRTIAVVFPAPEPAPAPAVKDEPPKPRPPKVDRKAARRKETLKKVFWSGVAVTAASGAAIGVLGGLERYWEREFDANKCSNPCPEDEDGNPSKPYPQEEEDRYEAYQLATNVMIGVTSVFAITTLVLGLRAYKRDSGSGRRARTPSVRLLGSNLVVRW